MTPAKLVTWISIGLALLAAGSSVASLVLAFMSGCAGDLKGGALGDPYRALELEFASIVQLVICVLAGAAAIGIVDYRRTHSVLGAVAIFIACVFGGAIVMWLAGIELAGRGVAHCFLGRSPKARRATHQQAIPYRSPIVCFLRAWRQRADAGVPRECLPR